VVDKPVYQTCECKEFWSTTVAPKNAESCRVTGESASRTKTSRNGGGYQKEMSAAKLLLLLAIICAFASFQFYTANDAVGDVPNWASTVCTAARSLCHSPRDVAISAAVLAGLWIAVTVRD
jgi:hypothetical protein